MSRRVVVEPQGAGDRVQHLRGRMMITPLFEPRVVLRADAREHRELVATQAGHAAAAGDGDPDIVRAHELPPCP